MESGANNQFLNGFKETRHGCQINLSLFFRPDRPQNRHSGSSPRIRKRIPPPVLGMPR